MADALLRVETPSGILWRRYNNDGYGQQAGGSSYLTVGQGRGWPLLTGERGHYEVAAQRSASNYVRWMEGFATPTHLHPEQSWDEVETTDGCQKPGGPTVSAVPLLWAHAEYIRLVRSEYDRKVFDRNPRVEARYAERNRPEGSKQFWSFACPIATAPAGSVIRIVAEEDFELIFTTDAWATRQCATSGRTKIRLAFADIKLPRDATSELKFTFRWTSTGGWEGRDFLVSLCAASAVG